MKMFKKVIALITVAVMALSVNAFAIMFEDVNYPETINTVAAYGYAANDNYICVRSGIESHNGYSNSVVHVYKNVDKEWKDWATVYPCFSTDSGDVPYIHGRMAMAAGNKLYMCLEARSGKGAPTIGVVDLDELNEGDEDVKTFKALRWDSGWGSGDFVKAYPYGDYVFVRKGSGNVCLYKDEEFVHAYAYGSMGPWDPTVKLNYAIKDKGKDDLNAYPTVEIYDGNTFAPDSSNSLQFTELKYTLKRPGKIADIIVSGNYAIAVTTAYKAYKYDLTNAAPTDVIEGVELSGIGNGYIGTSGGTWGYMDTYGKYCAIYTTRSHWLTVLDMETGDYKLISNFPSAGGSASAYVEFNDIGVAVIHGDGKTDVHKTISGVTMNPNENDWGYADIIDGEIVEDPNGFDLVKMPVSIINATLEDIDGNVILAAYDEEGVLVGVSVKPLSVVSETTGTVETDFVPWTSDLKVFYWTTAC